MHQYFSLYFFIKHIALFSIMNIKVHIVFSRYSQSSRSLVSFEERNSLLCNQWKKRNMSEIML